MAEINDIRDLLGGIMAVATLGLAGATAWMASKTAALIKQEQQQHIDKVMPVCALEPRSDRVLQPYGEEQGVGMRYFFGCAVRNSGLGPALEVHAIIRFLNTGNHEVPKELPPLGSGATWEEDGKAAYGKGLIFEASFQPGFEPSDAQLAIGSGWEIYLEYTDVLGNPYHTKHVQDGREPWVQFKKGRRATT